MTLRVRLLLGTAVVAIVLVAAAIAIARSSERTLVDQVDAQLLAARVPTQEMGREAIGIGPPETGPGGARLSSLYSAVLLDDGEAIEMTRPDLGSAAGAAPVLERAIVPEQGRRLVTVPSDNGAVRYRVLVEPIPPVEGSLVLALPLDAVDASVARLTRIAVVSTAAVLAVLALVTWWVNRLGVLPLRRMTTTAAAIAEGDLTQRVPAGEAGTEAGELGRALNRMLGSIEAAFDERAASEDRLRRFVADASHELRTPVTTIRGYAELYRAGAVPAGPALDDAMRRTEQEAVRMGALVDDLLLLARLDQGRPLDRATVDLSAVAADVVADARAVDLDLDVALDAPEPAVVEGDGHRLHQVLANLVANARVHAPGAAVRVRVRHGGSSSGVDDGAEAVPGPPQDVGGGELAADGRAPARTVVVTVADDGPGMAPEAVARATERFYRGDPSRHRVTASTETAASAGSGLGLSIVEAIVAAHGGRLELRSTEGAGTTVVVTLPARAS